MIEEILKRLNEELKHASEQAEYFMTRDEDTYKLYRSSVISYENAIKIVKVVGGVKTK